MTEKKKTCDLTRIEHALLKKATERIREEVALAVNKIYTIFTNNKIPLSYEERSPIESGVRKFLFSETTQTKLRKVEVDNLIHKLETIEELTDGFNTLSDDFSTLSDELVDHDHNY